MPHKEDQSEEFTPAQYPPFPGGLQTIDLHTISLERIQHGDKVEQDRMFEACKNWGFFYLDLRDADQGRVILDGAIDIARTGERVFALPVEEKMSYAPGHKELFGYKRVGQTLVDEHKTPDTAEFFNVGKNDMIVTDGEMKRKWPSMIMEKKPLFGRYAETAHSVGLQILEILAQKLGIDPEEIHSRHRLQDLAGDHIRITRGPPRKSVDMPEIQTPSHTDFGTITILMNWLGGLQVYGTPNRIVGNLGFEDGTGQWMWVEPRPGCAIINLGDAAVKFTNGVLCSGRHRVIPSPGQQGTWPRYSVVYFVRPTDNCVLKTLKGFGVPPAEENETGVNAKDWIFQQAEKLAGGKYE